MTTYYTEETTAVTIRLGEKDVVVGHGIEPWEFNVLIEQDAVAEKTAGGLYKPASAVEAEKFQAVRGTLVAASPLAFSYDRWPDDARKPQVGDRVLFVRHAGYLTEGKDGREYRVVKDKDVVARIAP